jgi:hypothetical protein
MTSRRPMSEFDPSQSCWVHEQLNDATFAWEPAWETAYRRNAKVGRDGPGIVNWDGLLLDGWEPLAGKST